MPLNRRPIIAKFSEVVPLSQYPTCYHGGHEALTVKLQKAEADDLLESVTVQFPPMEGEHASRYGLIVSLFWVCVLPPNTPLADHMEEAVATLKQQGRYEKVFGDIRVTLTSLGDQFLLQAHAL